MKSKIISKIVVFAALLSSLSIFQCLCFVPISSADDIFVIANKGINESSVTKQKLKNIFLRKVYKWDDNKKIIIAILKKGDAHELFLKKYLNITKSQYNTYLKNALYAGKDKMPKVFNSEKKLMEYVANTKGAIGYVSSEVNPYNTVKIITVN